MIQRTYDSKDHKVFGTMETNEFSIPQFSQQTGSVFSLDNAYTETIPHLLLVKMNTVENHSYVFVFSTRLESLIDVVSVMRIQLFSLSLIIVFLAFLLCNYLSVRISRPISIINTSANDLKSGSYSSNIPSNSFREFKELDHTLSDASVELSKTERYRAELMANVSHDLRTPLTLIRGYTEMIHDFPNDPEIIKNAELIMNESDRLTRLVNDILETTRVSNGYIEIYPEKFDLTACIEEIMERYEHIRDLGVQLRNHTDEKIYVSADKKRIEQVSYNLINNAIDYTNNGYVDIYEEIHENTVTVSIIDDGDGINKDEINNIWDRFYKTENAHKRSRVSTGIGLSIVKSILIAHSSKFGVKSKLNEGSCFWFELPLV